MCAHSCALDTPSKPALPPNHSTHAHTFTTPTPGPCPRARSLGGAMATICALDIRLNLGIEDVRLYTYGSPRVGNYVFAEWFRQYVKVRL